MIFNDHRAILILTLKMDTHIQTGKEKNRKPESARNWTKKNEAVGLGKRLSSVSQKFRQSLSLSGGVICLGIKIYLPYFYLSVIKRNFYCMVVWSS